MSQSLSKIYLHIIFHIKTSSPAIKEEHLERVHSYIGQLVNTTGCQTLIVGGVSNHVHIVCQLSKNETVSHLLEEVKRNSSRWIKTIDDRYGHFAWQGGYAAFSISESVLPKTINYVRNQKAHHEKSSFRKEYLDFLKHYKVEYDERYVFSD
ncbi:MAG: transposase [Bacteroidales bacterium]|jgi:REP element-mobilizing transposase RayT|nr:transposase [Bacteroidales bacterium]